MGTQFVKCHRCKHILLSLRHRSSQHMDFLQAGGGWQVLLTELSNQKSVFSPERPKHGNIFLNLEPCLVYLDYLAPVCSPECNADDFWPFIECFNKIQAFAGFFSLGLFDSFLALALNFWNFWIISVLLQAQRVQWEEGWVEKVLTFQYQIFCFTYQQTKCKWKNWVVSASAGKHSEFLQAKRAELVSQQNKIGKHRGRSSRSWKLTSPKATKQIAAREFGFVKDCVRLWELSLL